MKNIKRCAIAIAAAVAISFAPGAVLALAETAEVADEAAVAEVAESGDEDEEVAVAEEVDETADEDATDEATATAAEESTAAAAAETATEDEADAAAETEASDESDSTTASIETLSTEASTEVDASVALSWTAHIQTYGDTSGSTADATTTVTIGTTGQSKRLEAVSLAVSSELSGSITYRVHCQTYGWTDWESDGDQAGTTGLSKRVEAIEIELTGELAECYDVYYRVHSQTYGWLDWACNGETAGTTGLSKRAEAVQVVLVAKGSSAPGDTDTPYVDSPTLSVAVHQQTYGWLSAVGSGSTAGVTGKSKRLEALTVSVSSAVSGSITYSAHVQDVGWQDWVSEGEVAGTTGQSKRVEAVKIQLTGELAEYYDVYYRVHVQTGGWLGWAKNGAIAGTVGMGTRIEAIQVVIVAKGASAPGSTANASFSSVSGDHTLDRYLMKIYLTQGTNLKTLYQYVSTYTYIRTYDTPSGSWSSWSITYAKEMYANQGGNCYRYAALFCWLARGLGYDATVVTGYVPSRSSGWAPHGWCEITVDGTVYIVDPDLYKSYPSYNWYMVTYANAPTTYKKS